MMIMDMIKMARMDKQLVQLPSNCFCFFCGSMPILYSGMSFMFFYYQLPSMPTESPCKTPKRGTDYTMS